LGVLLRLPDGVDEARVVKEARATGLAPVPLSPWYVTPELRQAGLLLGVTNVPEAEAMALCRRLLAIVAATRS
jgi:GntR family transcriptional regulator/MocR family aminotransferase